jgi:hypothetical protein
LAENALVVEDYKEALEFCNKLLESATPLDLLTKYKMLFNRAIVGEITSSQKSKLYKKELEEFFQKMEAARSVIREKEKKPFQEILHRFLSGKYEDNPPLNEYLSKPEHLISIVISPRYAKGFLNRIVQNAQDNKLPEVFVEKRFRFTVESDFDINVKAYARSELQLNRLSELQLIKVIDQTLDQNMDFSYVESPELGIIAAVQKDGLVFCKRYYVEGAKERGLEDIRKFLNIISAITRDEDPASEN